MNDELSRLLSGELPEAEAEALRARIATDPELAARWATLVALPDRLAALPEELPGAPPLARAPSRRRWLPVALVAAAAAALLVVVSPGPPAALVLLDGAQLVDGHAAVLAGDVRVEVDGRARVVVEPGAGSVRGRGAEYLAMDRTHLLAALAGAAVTVTVYEGVARVTPAEAAPIELAAGETRTVGVGGAGGRAPERLAGSGATDAETSPTERIRALEEQVARLELENQVARGRLVGLEGKPLDWPADLPAAFRPDAFEAALRAAAAKVPGAEVVGLDCEEFPCIAVLRSTTGGPGWQPELARVHETMTEGEGFGEVGVVGMGYANVDDATGAETRLYGFSLFPGSQPAPEVSTRVQYRAEGLLQDIDAGLQEADPR